MGRTGRLAPAAGRLQAITQPASEGQRYLGEPVRLLAAEDGTTHVTY